MNQASFPGVTPPSLRRRERDRAQRRVDFLRAAAQVFAEKGYHEASIEEIAEVAEYGTGTIYLYFENKEDLYVALLEDRIRAMFESVRARIGAGVESREGLRRLIRAELEFFEENRAFFQTFSRERLELRTRLKQERWDRVKRAYERFIGFTARLVAAGQRQGVLRQGDPRRFAMGLAGIVNQLTRDWLGRRSRDSLAEQADFVTDLFFSGAAKR